MGCHNNILSSKPSSSELLHIATGRWISILVDAGIPESALIGRGGRSPVLSVVALIDSIHWLTSLCVDLCCAVTASMLKPIRGCGDGIATLRWWMNCEPAEAIQWLSAWLGVTDGTVERVQRPIERTIAIPVAEFDVQ